MDVSTTLYLIRHAETVWNQEQRYQGQKDIPLSATGRRQARLLARRLGSVARREPFDALWTSDLARARETAEILGAELGLAVRTHPGLREIHFGAWEGLTFPEVAARYPESAEAYRRDPARTRPPEGESFVEMQERAARALEEILACSGRRLLIVAHGGTVKGILCHLFQWAPESRHRLLVDNAAITVVLQRGGMWRLRSFNDTCHLEGCQREPPGGVAAWAERPEDAGQVGGVRATGERVPGGRARAPRRLARRAGGDGRARGGPIGV